MRIVKRVEFDAGHRVPTHGSVCRNPHGHRYVVEVEVSGDVLPIRGRSDDGMVLDFGDIKRAVKTYVDRWDHAFLVYVNDHAMRSALATLGRLESREPKTVVLDDIPTAENLARILRRDLDHNIRMIYPSRSLRVTCVTLYETPNSWAVSTSQEDDHGEEDDRA